MNKIEFIKRVASENGLTQKNVSEVLNAVMTTTANVLHEDEEINLTGFMKLTPRIREAYTARNPLTGESVNVPATRVVKCSISKALKEAVK